MISTQQTNYTKDLPNKKIFVTRQFNAPVETVWRAWTEAELLDQWWAPKPWKAETKSMEFKAGGTWLYCMAGPDGTKAYCRVDFSSIDPGKNYTAKSTFCDEDGNVNTDFPTMYWDVTFSAIADKTQVNAELTFDTDDDLQRIVAMGFEGGFAMGHTNLDELLAKM